MTSWCTRYMPLLLCSTLTLFYDDFCVLLSPKEQIREVEEEQDKPEEEPEEEKEQKEQKKKINYQKIVIPKHHLP